MIKTKAIKSVYLRIRGNNKHTATRNTYDGLFEGIADGSCLVSDLELDSVTSEDFDYLFFLLIRWNSNIRLDTLSVSKSTTPNCHEGKRCYEFCSLLSKFLSKNVTLRKPKLSLPFEYRYLMSYIDTIQSGLDQNSTIEVLTLITGSKVVLQRNKHICVSLNCLAVKDCFIHSLVKLQLTTNKMIQTSQLQYQCGNILHCASIRNK